MIYNIRPQLFFLGPAALELRLDSIRNKVIKSFADLECKCSPRAVSHSTVLNTDISSDDRSHAVAKVSRIWMQATDSRTKKEMVFVQWAGEPIHGSYWIPLRDLTAHSLQSWRLEKE